MATFARFGRWWERPKQRWYLKLLEDLRSELTWLDVLIGFCALAGIAIILIGFRHQAIPDYKLGQIADQDIRALQDVTFEDTSATNLRRAEAEASVPAIYQMDADLIGDREKIIAAAFARGRQILADNSITDKSALLPALEQDLLNELNAQIGSTFPSNLVSVFLRHRFNADLERRILRILDSVLRDGIISDRARFVKDQRMGILIRDNAYPFEHPYTNAYVARDLPTAREYLRQFHNDFSEFSSREKSAVIAYMESVLFPTLLYNREETESRRAQAAMHVQRVELQIRQGQTIIRNGEQVSPIVLLQLNALKNLRRPQSLIWQFCGYFLISAVLIYSLWRYFVFYQTRHRKVRNHMALVLVIIASELLTIRLATALAEILGERFQRFHDPSILYFGIPFAFGALLATLLVDVNLGIICSVIVAVLTGLFYGDIDMAAYLLLGSLGGIYSIRQYKDRAAILKAGLTISFVNILCLAGLGVLRQTPVSFADVLTQFVLALLSGILAAGLASILLPALEALFKIVTDIRLLELSNLNAPILRRLSVEAPGTYHHSLMVATLAEVAAESIGANSLLARVAAYYHDIGKMVNPDYFVENQSYSTNKHDDLSPKMSSSIIASHVKDGLQLAAESGLPQLISEMIPQHHGTRVMTYFFQKAKEAANGADAGIADSDFRYPGPKPRSREAAIMMMADSVEAASRTLSDPNPALIQGMIERLVGDIMQDNQLSECDITFKDVQLIKESFSKILTGIFHHRIDYPGYDFKTAGNDAKGSGEQNPGPEQTASVQH